MNCKPGDLAVVIKSDAGNEGVILRCIRLSGVASWLGPRGETTLSPVWKVDRLLTDWQGASNDEIADDQLRPIRDPGDDAIDESKAWLPPVPLPAIEPSLLEKT